ncbi:hypothetical protein DACRYDRAFT_20205 [Dacryopinax primogenitus]|uniref:Uncharacterized protein n=1 Tax=Dacryopinax primogenitus (strain DJM 731) TaxID=1858805 RepID=M5GGP6_DACPD|nr:uncharacterized protein DACRYDRAFT_20205 [Dacryopinax primogenitus]EJU05853.1 hypothetical protein DACRYDRAFT_20205 [Dacryopinax primogenitus]
MRFPPPLIIIGYEVTAESLVKYARQAGLPPAEPVALGNSLTERLGTKVVVVRLSDQETRKPSFFLIPKGFDREVYPAVVDLLQLRKQFEENLARVPEAFSCQKLFRS